MKIIKQGVIDTVVAAGSCVDGAKVQSTNTLTLETIQKNIHGEVNNIISLNVMHSPCGKVVVAFRDTDILLIFAYNNRNVFLK